MHIFVIFCVFLTFFWHFFGPVFYRSGPVLSQKLFIVLPWLTTSSRYPPKTGSIFGQIFVIFLSFFCHFSVQFSCFLQKMVFAKISSVDHLDKIFKKVTLSALFSKSQSWMIVRRVKITVFCHFRPFFDIFGHFWQLLAIFVFFAKNGLREDKFCWPSG